MPVLYSAGGENCFRRSCANIAKTDFCKCGTAAGSNGKAPLRKSEKTIETPTLRRFGAPHFKPMVGMKDEKAEADTVKTHRNPQKARKTQKAQKAQKSTEKRRKSTEGTKIRRKNAKKAQKRKEAYGLRNEEGRRAR